MQIDATPFSDEQITAIRREQDAFDARSPEMRTTVSEAAETAHLAQRKWLATVDRLRKTNYASSK